MDTKPWWVNPNFSNRIIGRESDLMVRDLISALEGESTERKRRRMRKTAENGGFVIFWWEMAVVKQ